MDAQSDWTERVSGSAQKIVSVLLIDRMTECAVSSENLKLFLMRRNSFLLKRCLPLLVKRKARRLVMSNQVFLVRLLNPVDLNKMVNGKQFHN
jgi:hypothetical protein